MYYINILVFYLFSGVLGSGVCIFSRWPIVEAMFHKWQVNGYVHKLTHGDWYGGKGIGFCRLNVNGFKINLYTCHVSITFMKDHGKRIYLRKRNKSFQ